LGILLWIAIIITAQAFQEIPKQHALAVALGLIPAFAAFTLELVVQPTLQAAHVTLASMAAPLEGTLHLKGLIALSQGFLLTSMTFAAILVYVIERQFKKAAYWCMAASVFSFTGLIHAYTLTAAGDIENKFGLLAAPDFGLVYLAIGFVLSLLPTSSSRS
jgi:AGZA family xanthine/uracil permease-like MFS transporter